MKKRTLLFSLTFAAVVAAMTAIGKPICSAVASNGIEYTEEEELVIVPVEYIESTGTQWIDLGIVLDTEIDFSIDFQPTERQTYERALLGGRNFRFEYYWAYRMFLIIDSISVGGLNGRSDARTVFKKEGNKYSCGWSSYTYDGDYCADIVTCYLFSSNALKGNHCIIARVFSAQIGDLDIIPVRFTNSHGEDEGAMYDLVTGKLFRNQGSGAFLIGPDL